MGKFRWIVAGFAVAIVAVIVAGLLLIVGPGRRGDRPKQANDGYGGVVPAGAMLRVPVTGIYPGGNTRGLNPDMTNPLANDPDAAERGMKDFTVFNCSGCHGPNGGGGMGPALDNDKWIYRSSPANIYLSIVQGRSAGMPAFGAMLPDRTVWELVAYIQSISAKPAPTFGTTTSADPQSPATEQIPAERGRTVAPWKYTEPKAKGGNRP